MSVGRRCRVTLLEKVLRGTSLKSVYDVAGVRVVVAGGRNEQDLVVGRVADAFRGRGDITYRDRRREPTFGYRAVHCIVEHGGLPVEVQIRTPMQHSWAEVVESLGDKWGRGIRYGEDPPAPLTPCVAGGELTRGQLWLECLDVSDAIDAIEEVERGLHAEHLDLQADYRQWEASVRQWFAAVASLAAQVEPVEGA